ncbi:MAG: GlcNAc-PI de-N-acetylase [Thermomicrobiales bacterium]|nr:MAG: GlcNAc-PI de-N-acetylase [Thermomicrobiales bacterium]
MNAEPISLGVLCRPSRHIFLSPHYDDIPLSCGGTVALLTGAGAVAEIVVIFGAAPPPGQDLSPFAQELHARWGVSAQDVVTRRRAEEEAAAAILGASVRTLDFPDAIYRGHRYTDEATLMGETAPDEHDLPERIVAAIGERANISSPGEIRWYAPLGIGGHVDHRLAFRAGAHLAAAGADVWLYEDLPYALRAGAIERRLAEGADALSPVGVVLISANWERKLNAIMRYRSQLASVFQGITGDPNRRDIGQALIRYARAVGQGEPGERYWRLTRL